MEDKIGRTDTRRRTRLTLEVDPDLVLAMKTMALMQGVSPSQLVSEWIERERSASGG